MHYVSDPGSYPRGKGVGFGREGASVSRFLPKLEGFRVWDGRRLRFRFLTPVGRVYGLGRKVLLGPGSYPGWKGLRFGVEGASGSRFFPQVEGFWV